MVLLEVLCLHLKTLPVKFATLLFFAKTNKLTSPKDHMDRMCKSFVNME